MSSTRFANRAAWLVEKGQALQVKSARSYDLKPHQVLVKVGAVALNPVDNAQATMGLFVKDYPSLLGHDLAGEIVELGSQAPSDLKIGDRVLGLAYGSMSGNRDEAAWQLFAPVNSAAITKIPSSLGYREASVLPLALTTAAHGLYSKSICGLDLPAVDLKPKKKDEWVVIYSGATSVGACALQLLRASGHSTATTASPKNEQLVRELGAELVFDHYQKNVTEQVIEGLKGKKVSAVLEMIGTPEAIVNSTKIAEAVGLNHIASVKPRAERPTDAAEGVEIRGILSTKIFSDEADIGKHIFQDYLPAALQEGKFSCKPEPVVAGKGLEGINNALARFREGVSAQKIVVDAIDA